MDPPRRPPVIDHVYVRGRRKGRGRQERDERKKESAVVVCRPAVYYIFIGPPSPSPYFPLPSSFFPPPAQRHHPRYLFGKSHMAARTLTGEKKLYMYVSVGRSAHEVACRVGEDGDVRGDGRTEDPTTALTPAGRNGDRSPAPQSSDLPEPRPSLFIHDPLVYVCTVHGGGEKREKRRGE